MIRRQFLQTSSLLLALTKLGHSQAQMAAGDGGTRWLNEFMNPPDEAYPWVYSFWMDGNITKEGITADIEAMKQAGIRGLLFMDGSLGNPVGPQRFMSESWLDLFNHMLAEAGRLGLQVNLNNDPGWAGSAGPWIKPEQATQKVVVAQTVVEGLSHFDGAIVRPAGIKHDFYEDIAVLAYPIASGEGALTYRIPGIDTTKSFAGGGDFAGVVPWPRFIPTNPEWPVVPADQCVQSAKMLDLTDKLEKDGKLSWDVPAGRWIILRFGHTVSNGATREAQKEAQGLEVDKLSKSAVEAHFAGMVGKLADNAGPLAGKVLVSTHIDSWEAGSGNWTNGFREEFHRLRGYDLLPFLPTIDGIVVDSREVSERFLWDFRETACQLLLENYAGHFRELARRRGLRLSIEAYDGTCDDLRYAGRADEPMTEFWRSCYSGLPLSDLSEEMTSAAHVYGKPIIGAEAFTSTRGDFLDHPATLKPMADWAFCTGVNRLCLSEWIMQPWPHLVPGVSFGTFGTVFQRSLTWWAEAKPWHDYLARCQHLLRQGQFVADVCFVVPEGAPYRFTPPIPTDVRGGIPDRPQYNFDGCPAELALKMTVQDGQVVLPSGMKYRLLVLPTYNADGRPVMRLMDQPDYFYKPEPMPKVETMTPELLRPIKALVAAGATVLGHRPLKSPSLASFPECDQELKQLADELWGENEGATGAGERRFGEGRVVWGSTPEQVLAGMGVPADFAGDAFLQGKLNYTHRRTEDGVDIYFVVNQQAAPVQGIGAFRATGKRPELYWPQTGRITPVAVFEESNGATRIPLSLHPQESVFVVFRTASPGGRIASITCDGKELCAPVVANTAPEKTDDSFMMAAWVTPGPEIVLPKDTGNGWAYTNDKLVAPGYGYQTFASPGQGRYGFTVGRNGIVVYQFSASGAVEPLLVHAAPMTAAVLVGLIYNDRIPNLFLNGKLVKTGPVNRFPEFGSSVWADRCPFAGEIATLQQFNAMLSLAEAGTLCAMPTAMHDLPALDFSHGDIWKPGTYALRTAEGESRKWTVHLPPPQEITGPWQVAFDPKWGGPANVMFEKLQDWATHSEEGIRYYSGTAFYRGNFEFARPGFPDTSTRVYLDLGKVEVMAEVILNGKNLGNLWNPPYRVGATQALKIGENTLEIKVVNLWVNRLIGDERLPEDCERDANGVVKAWPQWILEGKASPTGRRTFTSYRQWAKDNPLISSGLIGPVRLLTAGRLA